MIDAHAALRAHLIADSPLKTLLGSNRVYVGEVPGGTAMPGKAISFRVSGGFTYDTLRMQDARVTFKCYGSTALQAGEVYRALYDRLHGTQNFIVGDVGFHGISEDVPGVPLEDPATNWPYVHTVYTAKVATIPVSSGAGGS